MNEQVVEQRFKQIEDNQKEFQEEFKEFKRAQQEEHRDMDRKINNHDTAIAKIELLVEGMKTDWLGLKTDIQQIMNRPSSNDRSEKSYIDSFTEIAVELIKMIGFIVVAFVGAKMFFK